MALSFSDSVYTKILGGNILLKAPEHTNTSAEISPASGVTEPNTPSPLYTCNMAQNKEEK